MPDHKADVLEEIMELPSFESAKKTLLINNHGVKYSDFKASLKPNYFAIWLQIAFGYTLVIATLVSARYLQVHYPQLFWLTIPLGAVNVGYWFSFTHLFIHEASHYNIAPTKKLNDQLADIFLGFIAGTHINFYRIIHFDHHRYLGTVKDTENTYFEGLTWRFILESLTGIRVIKVVAERNRMVQSNPGLNPAIMAKNKKMTMGGALFNLTLVVILFVTGYWQVALTWMAGIGVIFPFFLSLRQLLEHRGEHAHADIDYTRQDQGETHRMFGTGIIASTMGSAGFNRHLLHHWDPQVSCTRLKDMERFLKDTELAEEMQHTHTSYSKTFLKLFNK